MSDPVMLSKSDLDKMAKDLDAAAEANQSLKRALRLLTVERDNALSAANKAKLEVERIGKVIPSDKVIQENKGLRDAIADAHRQINVLQEDLKTSKAETEVQRRLVYQVNRKFEGIQATFDTLQIARDKADQDRDKALADVQSGAAAYHKLQAEFDAFKKEAASKKPAAAPQPVKA